MILIPPIVGGLLLCVFVSASVHAQGAAIEKARDLSGKIKGEQETLESIQRQLIERRQKFDKAEKREISVLDELQRFDKVQHTKRKELNRLMGAVDRTSQDAETAANELEGIEGQLSIWRASLRERLERHYKVSRLDTMIPVSTSRALAEIQQRDRLASRLSEREVEGTYRKTDELETTQERKQAHEEMTKRLLGEQRDVEAALASIQVERKKKRRLIARIRDEQVTYEQTILELEKSAERIEELVQTLLAEQEKFARIREAGDGLAELKGALHWPSDGKVVAFFGRQKHPKFDTFLTRKGIDIKAGQGSVIRSVSNGIVAFADWLKGYGLLLIIDHGLGDVSLYAHASSLLVNEGDRVAVGQPVGAVGDTGLAGDSMLYFEVRAGGKAVDPIRWLSARK